jgi:hypothetical protein
MSQRTKLKVSATGTDLEILSDQRTISGLSDGVAANVEYYAEADGTPGSPNVAVIDATGAKKVFADSLPLPAGAATEASLATLAADIAQVYADLGTLNAKDFATQTTLAAIKTKTDNLDVALSTRLKPADTLTVSNAADARRTIITTVTRANDAAGYTAGDAIGALFTLAAASRLASQSLVLCHLKITTNNKLYVPALRVHFFNAANPASDVADNAAFALLTADEAAGVWQGCIDLPPMTTEDTTSTFAYAFDAFELAVVTDSGSALYGQIQAKTAISASIANQVLTITATFREK